MSKNINKSVENFIKELQLRINLLNSNSTRANLNEKNYKKLNQLVKTYINRSPFSLTTTDIVEFKVKDIKEILSIIGLDDDSIKNIIDNFDKNVIDFKNTYSQTKLVSATNYFEEIRKMIENYLMDYRQINDAQNDTFEKKTEEYQKYIEIFESEDYDSLFEDFDSLFKLMNNLAISSEDKWQILKFIADKNLAYEKEEIVDINLAKKVYDIVSKYLLVENNLVTIVKKELSKDDMDIDLIPHIASEIAKGKSLNTQTVKNCICALVANSLFDYYKHAIESDEDKEVVSSIRLMIEDVLKFYVKEENEVIKEARLIVENNEEFYNSYKENNKDDLTKFIDLSISEIESDEISHDMAVDLKTLPIIKTISETLDKIDRLFDESDDYELCCEILAELITAYKNLLMKKEHVGLQRINRS